MEKITKEEVLMRQLTHRLVKLKEKREDIVNTMIIPLETKIKDTEEKIVKMKSDGQEIS